MATNCTSCGRALPSGRAYCTRCGRPVDGGSATPASRGSGRWVVGLAALLILAVGAWALLRGGGGNSGEARGTAAGPIRLEMPEGSPAATVTPAGNLERLRALPGGERILAAGRFEPSGLAIPMGARVTYTLPARKAPGTRLPLLVLDAERGVWSATGVEARVLDDGTSAEGWMFHFTDGAVAEDEEPSVVVRAPTNKGVHTIDPEKLKAALEIYPGHAGEVTPELMKRLYAEVGFHGVKTLIEDGKISQQHSMDMADLRILMILQTWEKLAGDKYRIWRSDSGNQSSGMSSDVDQTIVVEELKDGAWVRAEHLDAKLAQEFPGAFHDMHQVPVDLFDIATIAGRDNFPDHRVTRARLEDEGRRSFAQHARESMFTLRRTPGAYTFCGAVVQQMQLRVMEKVAEQLRKGEDAARPAEPRTMHPLLEAHNPELRLNQMLLLSIGKGEGGDGPVRAREAFQEDATRVLFDSLPPKLLRGHVYDAAVANYFEFMHHLEDKYPAVKYHLRALDDGLSRLHALDTGTKRVEYEKLPENRRRHMLSKVLGADLGRPGIDGKSFLDRWKTAFDISAELRRLHGAKALTPESAQNAFKALATEIAVQVEVAKLVETGALDVKRGAEATRRQMEEAGERVRRDPEAWKAHVEEARASYDRRCQEFMLHNMVATAQQRVAEFVSKDADTLERQGVLERIVDEGPLRKQLRLEGAENEARWLSHREEFVRNHAFQAEMQLLYSFREIGAERRDLVEMILKDAEGKLSADDVHRLRLVAKRSRSWFFGLTELRAFPRTVMRFAALSGKQSCYDLCGKVGTWALSESGWSDDGSRRPSDLLKTFGFHGAHERMRAALAKHRTAGVVDRFVGKTVLQPGTLVAGVSVMRAFSESGGDPDVLDAALFNEGVNLLPIVGLIRGSYQTGGDLFGQAMMWLPVFYPPFGVFVICYTLGDHALVMYEHEISVPFRTTTADAIYRGYVGPTGTQRAEAPAQFTDADATHLKTLDGMVEELAARVAADEGDLGSAYALAKSSAEQQALQAKKAAWSAYTHEETLRQEGGALLNVGGFEAQKPVYLPKPPEGDQPYVHEGALLDRIRPIVWFAPDSARGAVDFRVESLTPAQEVRLLELERLLHEPQLPAEWVLMKAELDALAEQKSERARADEARAKSLLDRELAHQIRRDSLAPQLVEWRDQTPRMEDPEYLDFWIAVRSESLKKRLEELGVRNPHPYGQDVRDAVHVRLISDLKRSRELWYAHEALLAARKEAAKKQVARAQSALEAERLLVAAIQRPVTLGEDAKAALEGVGVDVREVVSPAALGRAMLERHVPVSPPHLTLGLRRVPRTESDGSGGGWEYRPDTAVQADTSVFVPPYVSVSHALDPLQAREALAAGAWKGLPLDADMRAVIERHLDAVGSVPADFDPKQGEFTPVVLTYVFCSDLALEERVVPETVAHLPRPAKQVIPVADGMPPLPEAMRAGFLLGGAALAPTALAGGKLKIRMAEVGSRTIDVVEVTSEGLEKLEGGTAGGLLFQLHRATTEAGLASSKPVQRAFVSARTPLEQGERVFDGRIAKDRLRLSAPPPEGDERGPFFYRVIQVPATGSSVRDAAPAGAPEKSNVLGPAPEVRVQLESVVGKADVFDGAGLTYLEVGLGVSGQSHLVAGAHAKATIGEGTWHAWAPRDGSQAWARVPLSGVTEPLEVRLELDGGGMRAARTIRLLADPALRESIERQVAEDTRRMEEGRARSLREVESFKQRADGARRGLADFRARLSGQGWHGQVSIANAELDLADAEGALRVFEEVELLDREAIGDVWLAQVRRDWTGKIAVLQRRVTLARQRADLQRELVGARIAKLGSIASAAPDEAARRTYEQGAANQRKNLESVEDTLQSALGSLGNEIASAALEAGVAAACRDGMALYVHSLEHEKQRGHLNERDYAERRGGAFLRLAHDMARLTGNRAQSKTLLEEGRRLLLAGAAPERRADLEARWRTEALPEWWPE